MTDREKLIALVKGAFHKCLSVTCKECEEYDKDAKASDRTCQCRLFADHLIANGVVVREWIPVTERLPEKEDTYLVYTERGSVYASHFYTEKKFASGYVREASWSQRGKVKVTHWMPLPEPPMRKGENG